MAAIPQHRRAAPPQALQPKPKRVRRDKVEREYLRDLVGELEAKLTVLQCRRLNGHGTVAGRDRSRSLSTTWMDRSVEEVRKRERALKENQHLRHSIQQQDQLASKLRLLVDTYMAQRGLLLELNSLRTSPRRKFWDLARDAEEDIFTEQLADVAQLRLEAQQQVYEDPRRAADVSWGLSRGHAAVKSDPHFDRGVVLELHCRTTVPFSLEVAARAYWRMFCTEHGELQGADSAVKVVTDTTTRSFTLRLEFEGLVSDTSGKYTCQKSVSADEVEIAWVEHADVMEFGGVKFNGMQYQKRAFMKLRPVSREGLCQRSAATEVETHFETFPIFRDNVTDSWDQTLAFVNRAQQTHNKLDALVCQHMSNLLLEEDWKAAFG